MPQNVTDSLTYTATIQSVADGDAANGADFLLAPQGLANRTAWLKNILATVGINLIQSGTLASMQALHSTDHPAGIANGAVYLVPGIGLFHYVSGGGGTADGAFVLPATNLGGQWQHELLSLLNVNLGIPAIGPVNGSSTPAGKIPTSVQTNCLIGFSKVELNTSQTTTSSAVDITGLSTSITVQTNDILVCHLDVPGSISSGQWQTAINANGSVIAEAVATAGAGIVSISCHSTFVATSNATITVKGQFSSDSGSSAALSALVKSRLVVEQFRP